MEVFVDTSAWFRYVAVGRSALEEAQHRAVREAIESLLTGGVRMLTTNLVLAETHQLLLIRTNRTVAREFLGAFPAAGVEVARSDEDLERRAVSDWMDRLRDHDFSLTDCVSFALMKHRKVRRALALDRHFSIAGFELVRILT